MRKAGWLAKIVEPFLQNWSPIPESRVSGSTTSGIPNQYNADPRISVSQWKDNGDNLTIGFMIGTNEQGTGLWQEADFTPEQGVRIIASILSKPIMEKAAEELLEALKIA